MNHAAASTVSLMSGDAPAARLHAFDSAYANGLRMRPLAPEEIQALETPAYVFDAAVVRARYAALRQALGTQLVVSLKANSLVDLLMRCAPAFVDGVELASIGELGQAVGRVSTTKFVNNPSMDQEFMQAASVSGCTFIVDSVDQAQRLSRLPRPRNGTRTLLRLNSGAQRGLPRHDHFGMQVDDAVIAGRLLAAAGCTVDGVHAFNGSHNFVNDGVAHVEVVAQMLPAIEGGLGHRLRYVNLGGGFSEDWESQTEAFARYRASLSALADHYTLAHESGRGVFARAGVFVTRVVTTKTLGQRHIAVCDGGMGQNFLLAATEGMLRKHRSPTLWPTHAPATDATDVQFVGSSCSRQDVIGQIQATTHRPKSGDYCLFDDCGAYNSSYTVSKFLSLPPPRLYVRAEVDAE
ncbi:alanine racemase [Tahibacter amnicola]|uniref:Alanine racemase n=1 Tax=Tahibacter amnicola TaxID=2976241 RepID=A0ABY6B7X4_9GAMM|nr:alanine racemase [Tahibacter amnicola]UXI66186.1 alanine racemase [Tahibacter amnicola]